jgi:hypothetical protein
MTTYAPSLRHPAGAALALAAVGGLILTGCSTGSSGSSGGSGSTSSKAASSSSASAKAGSGSSGGSTSVVSADSLPFPIAVGNTWKYTDTDGATVGTTVDTIAAVTPVADGQQVKMDGTISNPGLTSHSSAYFIFHSDGSITYPFSQFNTSSSTTKVTLLSGTIMFPSASALAAGQVSHGTLKIQFTSSGVTRDLTSHITVKGGGTQTVTVPAGTYSASVVQMTMSESIEGITVSTEVMTWFANGVGPVKSEVILNEAGTNHVADVNQLTSFTKG